MVLTNVYPEYHIKKPLSGEIYLLRCRIINIKVNIQMTVNKVR